MNECIKHEQRYPQDGFCVYCGRPENATTAPITPAQTPLSVSLNGVCAGAMCSKMTTPGEVHSCFAGSSLPKQSNRFDRFTERARRVITLAEDEARRFNHTYIGTEHLLLGLVREGDGVATKILANLGVELPRVRSAVEFTMGRGTDTPSGEILLTPRAKKVIELALDEGRRLGHRYIGTEHLLAALVREGEGIAAGVLESLGVNLERVREQITPSNLPHVRAWPQFAKHA